MDKYRNSKNSEKATKTLVYKQKKKTGVFEGIFYDFYT